MVVLPARIHALVFCFVTCGSVSSATSHGGRRVAAFTSAAAGQSNRIRARNHKPSPDRSTAAGGRRMRPRRSPPRAGRFRLTAVEEGKEKEEEEEEDTAESGVYVATEALLDDPSHIERILASMAELAPGVPPMKSVFSTAVSHHCALRTSNITRALKFYSLLGMNEVVRFKAEKARCAFLEGAGMRLELIEVPASMEPEDKAADLAADMRSTGLNHIAFDVGPAIEAEDLNGMKGFLSELNRQSEDAFGMSVRLVVSPYEQRIGQDIFELAFIMDADGVLLELVHKKDTLDVDMPQAW
ncbi:unnamed protein product [Scytosiphon promiscuus]